MKKGSLLKSDRCAGFATVLKGRCEMFRGSLFNRLARAVPALLLVVAISQLTAARVEGKEDVTHQAILDSVGGVQSTVNTMQTTVNTIGPKVDVVQTSVDAVQTTVNTIGPKVDVVQTSVGTVQTTVNSIENKVDDIKANLNQIPPAWSQILPAADRFQLVMGGAAALDRETGLVWEKSPIMATQVWSDAHVSCHDLAVGGRRGWRLPTIQELASLVDPTIFAPVLALPPGHPFISVQSSSYWSATSIDQVTNAGDPLLPLNPFAWRMAFVDPAFSNTGSKTTGMFHVWCVRGGQGVAAQ